MAQHPLKNFDQVVESLKKGKTVRVIIHYGDCMPVDNNKIQESAPDAVAGMAMDVFEYFAPVAAGNEKAFFWSVRPIN